MKKTKSTEYYKKYLPLILRSSSRFSLVRHNARRLINIFKLLPGFEAPTKNQLLPKYYNYAVWHTNQLLEIQLSTFILREGLLLYAIVILAALIFAPPHSISKFDLGLGLSLFIMGVAITLPGREFGMRYAEYAAIVGSCIIGLGTLTLHRISATGSKY